MNAAALLAALEVTEVIDRPSPAFGGRMVTVIGKVDGADVQVEYTPMLGIGVYRAVCGIFGFVGRVELAV